MIKFVSAALAGALLAGMASMSSAQSVGCVGKLDPSVSKPSDLIACLVEMQADIDALETELAPFRNAKGAVLAFDRSGATSNLDATSGYCPPGWEWFEPSGGRMIIGAGQHQNKGENGAGLKRYPSFLEIPGEAVGGAETHTLIEEEMPEHRHSMFAGGEKGVLSRWPGGKQTVAVGGDVSQGMSSESYAYQMRAHTEEPIHGVTGALGKDKPHNNMPPYIALYFCKKLPLEPKGG